MITARLRAARQFDPAAHLPLWCAGQRIGWLRRAAAHRLGAWPRVFERDAKGVRVADALKTPDARTAAIGLVVETLHKEGSIQGWRHERYAVAGGFDQPPLFHIERAAARYLGTTTYAAHVNGYCHCASTGDCEMWLARRSAAKPIDPRMLDNLVGGGMSAGVAPLETVVREGWEEAGIAADLARLAVAAGTVRLLREVPEGVQSEVIFVHDLELPNDFQPINQDGEVDEFLRVPLTGVVAMVAHDAGMTLDASLVASSFLARRGYVSLDGAAGVIERVL
jgi:8-oxo-dGTP pyrophosphatase MutT (NUDIX family)